MDSSSIQLPGSEIATAELRDGDLVITFSRARIIKTMTGSAEQTRWWQAGELILGDAELDEPLPPGPLVCAGGDLEQGVYVYRDMIPVPLPAGAGGACDFRVEGTGGRIRARARTIRLAMHDLPKYAEHLRPGG